MNFELVLLLFTLKSWAGNWLFKSRFRNRRASLSRAVAYTSDGGVDNKAGMTCWVSVSNFNVLPVRVPADRDRAVPKPKYYSWFCVASEAEDCIY